MLAYGAEGVCAVTPLSLMPERLLVGMGKPPLLLPVGRLNWRELEGAVDDGVRRARARGLDLPDRRVVRETGHDVVAGRRAGDGRALREAVAVARSATSPSAVVNSIM